MSILGYSTHGGSNFGSAGNYALYSRYMTDGVGGALSELRCYVQNIAGADRNFYMAVYTDTRNADDTDDIPYQPVSTPSC